MNDRLFSSLFKLMLTVAVLVCTVSVSFGAGAANEKPKVEVIRLDGLVPDLPIRLRESWNAIGIDPNDNVYALFGGATDASSDCALFQYNAATGKTRLVGTISQGDRSRQSPSGTRGLSANGLGAGPGDAAIFSRLVAASAGAGTGSGHSRKGQESQQPSGRRGRLAGRVAALPRAVRPDHRRHRSAACLRQLARRRPRRVWPR